MSAMDERPGNELTGIPGKIVLITGGNRNIGRSIALTMARAGAIPGILFREAVDAARTLCDEVAQCGGRAGMYQADLASYTTAQEFFVSGGAFPLVRQPTDDYAAEEF
jgi:NAD(P)-dependent dehydrogenase (short-subunit alcohol dehydrogenase family)